MDLIEKSYSKSVTALQGKLLDLQYSNPDFMTKLLKESLLKDRNPIIHRNSAYLISRSLISPGYNDSIIFPFQSVIRAANLVYSSLRFFESLRKNKLNPDLSGTPKPSFVSSQIFDRFINVLPSFLPTRGAHLFRVFPLDISSYHHLFQTSRVPDFEMDRLTSLTDSRHIVVVNQADFYFFDVFDHQGNMISCEQLVANLEFIRLLPRSPIDKPNLGLITTMNRDDAARARNRMRHFDGYTEGLNTRNLKLLDSAILILVMWDEPSDNSALQISSALTGPGGSRWFDKTFSLLINQNGDAALNVVDGIIPSSAILRFANSIYNDAEIRPIADPWILESPQRLVFFKKMIELPSELFEIIYTEFQSSSSVCVFVKA
ncbi:unnamed protein product [Hymenolepis diminuta]|uniref:Choline/carnitine acyltransferase domain-containing protein n=1 Tax=Hymenolepis diminuta TaxID=6216 RepID=A0A3P6ZAU4_HYMDI|nr:unnamed protein product [Hymenolepis diminuta]